MESNTRKDIKPVSKDSGFSIVIATHNRYAKLTRLLESISEINPENLSEVIIVDDSDNTEEITGSKYQFNVKHLKLKERVFISAAKNIGWKSTVSPFVYFIDDDNQVDKTTFTHPLRFLTDNIDTAAVFPSVLYNSMRDTVWVYATPFKKGKWNHVLTGRNQVRNKEIENRIIDIDALPNAFVIRMKCLDEIGGFNEKLPVHNSTYLTLKLKSRGYRVVADTSSFIFHDVKPPGKYGYWAMHAISDPRRLYFEIRDWIILNRIIHSKIKFYTIRAAFHASKFLIPNIAAYFLFGKNVRRELAGNILKGFISGLKTVSDQNLLEEIEA